MHLCLSAMDTPKLIMDIYFHRGYALLAFHMTLGIMSIIIYIIPFIPYLFSYSLVHKATPYYDYTLFCICLIFMSQIVL